MEKYFNEIINRKTIPDSSLYLEKLEKVIKALDNENESLRPKAIDNSPGGIIHLYHDIPTIIVPDIHARMELISSLANLRTEIKSFFQLMADKEIQVVCVGDGFHSELNGKDRWIAALSEYEKSYKKHQNIDEEMSDCLGLMEMIMELKTTFPENFHFLKGNHENIKNEETGGDHPFRKFVLEGEMVKTWVKRFMGEYFLDKYSEFETKLPLLAIGEQFMISHAEPKRCYEPEEIINYQPEVIHGLTWTANGEAEEGSVRQMLDLYIPDKNIGEKLYFGGHRIINNQFKLRADGLFVQIHNPWNLQVVYIKPECIIDLEKDIIDISGSK
jgi:hypothetical protein